MTTRGQICASAGESGDQRAALSPVPAMDCSPTGRLAALVRSLPFVVASGERLEQVARLRYRAYLRAGAIAPDAAGAIRAESDGDSNAATYAFLLDDQPIATIRVHVVRGAGHSSPACRVFPDIVADWIAQGRSIIDPSCFCVDPVLSRRFPSLALVALRVPVLLAQAYAPSWLLATPRRGHEGIYLRNFGGLRLADPRPYPGRVHPLALVGNRMEAIAEAVFRRYPAFRGTAQELEAIRLPFAGAGL